MPDPRLALAESLLAGRKAASARQTLDTLLAGRDVGAIDRRAALLLRSRAHEDERNLAAAIADLRAALAIRPDDARVRNTLGVLLADTGDAKGAMEAFVRATDADANYARAWNNLGNAQRNAGQADAAEASFRRAVALQPDYGLAAANLAVALRDRGDLIEAEATLRAALAANSKPAPYRPLLVLLAGILRERSVLDESANLYLQAIKADPVNSTGEWFNLGWVLSERGEPERARDAFARGTAARAPDLRNTIGRELVLPMVHADRDALDAARGRYAAGVDALLRDAPAIVGNRSVTEVQDGLRWTNFLLAYQGGDDRALQSNYAAFVGQALDAAAPQWRAPIGRRRSPGERLRIGFASAFFHVGTCGRYFRSWITDLDPARFEVVVYHLYPGIDEIAAAIRARSDVFRSFGVGDAKPSVVAPAIRADDLDALVYPELGMDVTSFALAAMRLAPRQFAGWGHPVTTGHATIDGFFSCDSMERPDSDADYAEPLHRLPGIGTCYLRPDVPTDATRERFALPADRILFLCPQSLFKIHPDNDRIHARLLADNPQAMLVLFSGRHPAITDQYMRRLTRALDDCGIAVRERTRVLPPVPHDDYLRINTVCDAMLDTLHWSGGNTSLDALACGLPVVTMAGRFMRGRQTAGMLRQIGVDELVAATADDYLRLATELAGDAARRAELRRRILAAQDRLFGDRDAVRVFGDTLHRLVVAERAAPSS